MTKKEYNKSLCKYPEALTAKEVAEILRVSIKTVYKMLSLNVIPSVKVGRQNRISKSELINYLRKKDKESTNPKCVLIDNSQNNLWTSQNSCDIVRVAETKRGVNINGYEKHTCRKRTG